jgi:magnesium-transporting ATPase (P-type)
LYKVQEEYAEQSMRTLALGYKDYTKEEFNAILAKHPGAELDFFTELKNEIKLVCIVGIADKPRSDVKAAIYQCGQSGILVRMVTGDNIKTAIAISKDVGILNEAETRSAVNRVKSKENKNNNVDVVFGNVTDNKIYALEGSEFKELTKGYRKTEEIVFGKKVVRYELVDEKKFAEVVQNLKVIARASPDDKFLLVFGLKKIGNIVAVTGDGTNDAPALINSHVGFAMGKRGTDIAKASSDIVLLDDSFRSIVTAIKYGRNVYDCIRKFLQFQLTCNVVAVFMTLLGGTILKDSPLNAIQMLWVNLIMDSFASLALATEPPTDKLLERKPYPMDSKIITPMMMINIVSQSVFQILLLTVILFYGDVIFGVPSDRNLSHFEWNQYNGYHFTIFFNIFVFLQVFNSINARKLSKNELNIFENIFDNYLYFVVQFIIVAGQIIMVQFGGRALRTQPLTVNQHLACVAIASLSLVIGFIIKLLPFDTEDTKTRTSLGLATRTRSTKKSVLPTSKSTKRE